MKPRKLPLIAVPFVLALQAVALAGALAALGALALCCKVLDVTSKPDGES